MHTDGCALPIVTQAMLTPMASTSKARDIDRILLS